MATKPTKPRSIDKAVRERRPELAALGKKELQIWRVQHSDEVDQIWQEAKDKFRKDMLQWEQTQGLDFQQLVIRRLEAIEAKLDELRI